MQFRRVGAQWRRSGRSFAPECRSWVMSISRQVDAATKAGHELPGSLALRTRGVMHPQGSPAETRAGIGHTNRFRHIANTSHY
jgi:hypothetical protein